MYTENRDGGKIMDAAQVLIVDDEPEIREIVRVLLQNEGYALQEASSGEEALGLVCPETDLIILDVMMPGMSGYQTCLKLRQVSHAPILFLTAKTQDSDLTMGFSAGGDDYLAKPFSYPELVARVKGLLRRYQVYKGKPEQADGRSVQWRDLRLDCDHNEVWKRDVQLNLTNLEYQILRLMLLHQGKIFSAHNLYESVWGEPYYAASSNTVLVHIRRLREKIEDDPQKPSLLVTVWGKGYRIE